MSGNPKLRGGDPAREPSKSPIMRKLFVILLSVAALSGCAVQQQLSYTESSTRNVEPAVSAVIVPMVAGLEMLSEEKIASFETTVPGEVSPALIAGIESWKRFALSEAARKYGADLLVGASVTVATRNNRLVISVEGWPARYAGFRPATEADAWMTSFYHVAGGDNAALLTSPAQQAQWTK